MTHATQGVLPEYAAIQRLLRSTSAMLGWNLANQWKTQLEP